MVPSRVWISIPSSLDAVRLLAAAVRGVLGELGFDAERASTTELCVVEAVNNAIEHAYASEAGHRVDVELTIDGERVDVAVIDDGRSIPAGVLESASLGDERDVVTERDELPEGGWGLGLIVQLMSGVRYRRADDRNVLTMSTCISGSAP
jgi:serine/threonine-protein kinase RsbW